MLATAAAVSICVAGAASGAELQQAMDRAHFAFRPAGAGFVAADLAHQVDVAANGSLRFTPWRGDVAGAGVRIAVEGIERGGRPLPLTAPRARVVGGTRLELRRGAVTETLDNTGAGVEQRFVFDRAPAGIGDVTVRLALTGEAWVGASGGGNHFRDAKAAIGVRYGAAVWIAADGKRTPLVTQRTARGLTLRVPSAVIAGSRFPAEIDPMISAELGVDDPVIAGPTSRQDSPSVAFDGTNFLVVWRDFRAGPSSDLYATRVFANATTFTILDPNGLVVTAATGGQYAPDVTFGQGTYFASWSDNRAGPASDIWGARISPAGVVQDPGGISIGVATGIQTTSAVAFDGADFLVVWQDGRAANTAIDGARVSLGGVLLDTTSLSIAAGAYPHYEPAIASDGTNALVAWEDWRNADTDVYATKVSQAGGVGPAIQVSGALNTQDQVALDFDGTNYLAVWRDGRNSTSDIYGARITSAPAVIDPAGVNLTASVAGAETNPRVAFGSGLHFVVWMDTRTGSTNVFGGRVTTAATRLDGTGFPLANTVQTETEPSVAVSGSTALVGWTQFIGANNFDVDVARISATAVVLDFGGRVVSLGANPERNGAVAFDGAHYFAVWQDQRGPDWDIYGALINPNGTLVSPAATPICTAPMDQLVPVVAFDGTGFVVAWQDARNPANGTDIYGARVSGAGVVLDPSGIAIDTQPGGQDAPAIASNGAQSLIAWSDSRGPVAAIYAARLSSGVVLDPTGFQVSASATACSGATVASNGTDFLVAWQDLRAATALDVYAARISGAVVQDVGGIPISVLATSEDQAAAAGSAANGYFIAWRDGRAGVTQIYGARVSSAGALQDPAGIAIATNAGAELSPAVAYDPSAGEFGVVWEDDTTVPQGEVRVATVKASSGLVAGNQQASGFGNNPAGAITPTGAGVVLYDRFVDPVEGNNYRVRMRLTGKRPDGAACAMPDECTNGYCEGLVCCATACPNGTCSTGVCVVVDAGADGGPADAGPFDAGAGDAGAVDAGAQDAGEADAGPVDAGAEDAGVVDAGELEDAGAEDAGVADAGALDAGPADAGEVTSVDPVRLRVGCGCDAASGGAVPLLWLLLWRARRRQPARGITRDKGVGC